MELKALFNGITKKWTTLSPFVNNTTTTKSLLLRTTKTALHFRHRYERQSYLSGTSMRIQLRDVHTNNGKTPFLVNTVKQRFQRSATTFANRDSSTIHGQRTAQVLEHAAFLANSKLSSDRHVARGENGLEMSLAHLPGLTCAFGSFSMVNTV